MPLSTEDDDTPDDGLIPDRCAYVVDGARFWIQQSEAFKAGQSAARHYRFMTGWTGLDLISSAEPLSMLMSHQRRRA